MESFEIVGIEEMNTVDGNTRLAGFYLNGVPGAVDVFVDGVFMPPCLKALLDDNDMVLPGMEAEFFRTELSWAREQIGKKLKCEGLVYTAIATIGEVAIE